MQFSCRPVVTLNLDSESVLPDPHFDIILGFLFATGQTQSYNVHNIYLHTKLLVLYLMMLL